MSPFRTLSAFAVVPALLIVLGPFPCAVAGEQCAEDSGEKKDCARGSTGEVGPGTQAARRRASSGREFRIRRVEFLDGPMFAEPRTYGIAERFLRNLYAPVKACPVLICGGACRNSDSGCQLLPSSRWAPDDDCRAMCAGADQTLPAGHAVDNGDAGRP